MDLNAMTPFLFILSCPIQVPGGGFGVMTGTADSVDIRLFASLWRARGHHMVQLASLRAAVDAPLDVALIEGVSDYQSLKHAAENEYGRRGLPLPSFEPVQCRAPTRQVFGWLAAVVDGFMSRLPAASGKI
jgi:hypothetical protein